MSGHSPNVGTARKRRTAESSERPRRIATGRRMWSHSYPRNRAPRGGPWKSRRRPARGHQHDSAESSACESSRPTFPRRRRVSPRHELEPLSDRRGESNGRVKMSRGFPGDADVALPDVVSHAETNRLPARQGVLEPTILVSSRIRHSGNNRIPVEIIEVISDDFGDELTPGTHLLGAVNPTLDLLSAAVCVGQWNCPYQGGESIGMYGQSVRLGRDVLAHSASRSVRNMPPRSFPPLIANNRYSDPCSCRFTMSKKMTVARPQESTSGVSGRYTTYSVPPATTA